MRDLLWYMALTARPANDIQEGSRPGAAVSSLGAAIPCVPFSGAGGLGCDFARRATRIAAEWSSRSLGPAPFLAPFSASAPPPARRASRLAPSALQRTAASQTRAIALRVLVLGAVGAGLPRRRMIAWGGDWEWEWLR